MHTPSAVNSAAHAAYIYKPPTDVYMQKVDLYRHLAVSKGLRNSAGKLYSIFNLDVSLLCISLIAKEVMMI